MRCNENARKLFAFLTILSKLSLSGCDDDLTGEEIVLINTDVLPLPYSDEKLPQTSDENNKCYPLLGCIEMLPMSNDPQLPITLLTEFAIYGEEKDITVPFKPVKHCLQNSPDDCEIYPFNLNSILESTFNPELPTVFVTKGYWSKVSMWQYQVKDLWKKWTNANVIIVLWPGGNSGMYPQSVANTRLVARQITVLLYYLTALHNLSLADERFLSSVYLVGHSLGAHISGFVGKDLRGKIGRITGLDPAGPMFIEAQDRHRLDKADAQLVEALHTNGGQLSKTKYHYGLSEPVGHLDYYANNGKSQPSCSRKDLLGCSHRLATAYYISVLEHQIKTRQLLGAERAPLNRLLAFQANNFTDFDSGASLLEKCPETALNEESHLSDMNKCTLPMDFFAPAQQYRAELEQSHNLNFSSDHSSHHKAYFYTSEEEPYLGDHGILRVKANDLSQNGTGIQCDLKLRFKSSTNGQETTREMNSRYLVKNQLVLPQFALSFKHSFDLALLDDKDFYLDWVHSQTLQLSSGIRKTFARLFDISGVKVRFGSPARNSEDAAITASPSDPKRECQLSIKSITLQPLKRLNRNLLISYSDRAKSKEDIDIIIRQKGESLIPITSRQVSLTTKSQQSAAHADAYLDSVFLGSQKSI